MSHSLSRLLFLATVTLTGCGPATERPAADPRPGTDPAYLLIRSDDAGMTHAVNAANRRLIESGMPVSVSIMFPTPWWQETVELLRAHPDVSVGIHLTLNSEWKNYRWGPVVGQNAAPTLVDEHGFFFPSARDLYDNEPDLGEVELELRAQIERAMATGLTIDYVDFHMGTVRSHPGFLEIARRLAGEYGLLMSGFNDEVMWDPQYRASPGDKPDSLAAMVTRLEAPFNVVITHPGLDTPEMAALVDMNTAQPLESMAMHRQAELDALLSPELARALRNSAVRLITYRDLRAMLGSGPEPTLGEGDPATVGPIVARDVETPSSGERPTLHVRPSGDECGVIYSVSPETVIRRKNDRGSFDELSLDELRVGVTVAVWTDVVLQSCPGQAGAHAIEVL